MGINTKQYLLTYDAMDYISDTAEDLKYLRTLDKHPNTDFLSNNCVVYSTHFISLSDEDLNNLNAIQIQVKYENDDEWRIIKPEPPQYSLSNLADEIKFLHKKINELEQAIATITERFITLAQYENKLIAEVEAIEKTRKKLKN